MITADIIGTNAGDASNPRRKVRSRVAVIIDVRSGQQIKRMRAVVTKNRRQLKAGKDTTLPRTLNHAREHHLVPLIKARETTFCRQIGLVIRSVVAVEIGRRLDGFPETVISPQQTRMPETL